MFYFKTRGLKTTCLLNPQKGYYLSSRVAQMARDLGLKPFSSKVKFLASSLCSRGKACSSSLPSDIPWIFVLHWGRRLEIGTRKMLKNKNEYSVEFQGWNHRNPIESQSKVQEPMFKEQEWSRDTSSILKFQLSTDLTMFMFGLKWWYSRSSCITGEQENHFWWKKTTYESPQ